MQTGPRTASTARCCSELSTGPPYSGRQTFFVPQVGQECVDCEAEIHRIAVARGTRSGVDRKVEVSLDELPRISRRRARGIHHRRAHGSKNSTSPCPRERTEYPDSCTK